MKGAEALRAGVQTLRAAGIDGAERDARRLLAYAMEIAPDRITLVTGDTLTPEATDRFDAAIAARAKYQPVAQITGTRDFFGRSFRVTPDTLDPRPETEALVLAALEAPFARVLDMGTGTGCILLTLLAEQGDAQGLGTDLSEAALGVAQGNAVDLGIAADFAISDWYSNVTGRFDLIVSNPPYIAASEMAGLSPDVRDWEPHMALTDDADGLSAYRAIAGGAEAHLTPGGRLLVEIGATQRDDVSAIFAQAGLANIKVWYDLDQRPRVVGAMRLGA